MAQQLLARACQRFRDELTPKEDHEIRTTSWQDVQHAIVDIERQLAARQCLRNLDRISPYLKAVEGYGTVVEIFCNSSSFVPYVWASNLLLVIGESRGQYAYLATYNRVLSNSSSWYACGLSFPSAQRLIATQAVREQTQALDKLLSSYAQLGNALPRLSALREALQDNHAVQQLFVFLYEDIVEFHRRVYKLIRKPGTQVFGEYREKILYH